MINNPKFSIITICYNSGKTIEWTIKSVLSQSCTDFEYIIVDGGSNDNTIDIIKKYQSLFEGRLSWVSEPDNGIYDAMNKGIKKASGEIVGIVNSDDWLEYDALETLNTVILQNSISLNMPFVITGNMRFHYLDGSSVVMKTSRSRFEKYVKRYRMGLNHPATFVSKKAYDEVGLFDENIRLLADTDLMVRMYKANVPFYFTDDILSNMMDGGASNQRSSVGDKDRKYILSKHSKNMFQYFYLRMLEAIEKQFKKLPYGAIKQYRKIKNI